MKKELQATATGEEPRAAAMAGRSGRQPWRESSGWHPWQGDRGREASSGGHGGVDVEGKLRAAAMAGRPQRSSFGRRP
ncbi:unnamed protein product [Urochloa humidicola]